MKTKLVRLLAFAGVYSLLLMLGSGIVCAQGLTSGALKLISADELGRTQQQVVRVNFDTSRGSFVMAVYPQVAPHSTENFLRLVNSEFYDGLKFHRVVENFVAQAGELPEGDPRSELDKPIPDEINYVHHEPGTVSLAKLYDTEKKQYLPDSAGAQFFINLGENQRLDENFTVFGQVTQGMDVVKKLQVGDRIIRAYVINPL
ncbi:MAG: hypothetical protein B1H03_06580 [Planctomycetales bacterium 4484_113]|nr:MAG: hypothetical protein B1H03_06580 [Planctomycetales bacterium 4484_113]